MSIPSTSIVGGVAGSPLAQSKGSEVDRTAQETAAHKGHVQSALKAEAAAGIGRTDGEDNQAADRDADGRRLWERPNEREAAVEGDEGTRPGVKDPSGQSGTQIDLCG